MGENTEETAPKPNENCAMEKATHFRRFLAQFLATTVENLLLFDMGLGNSFPFIIIPALTGIFFNQHNTNETLKITEVESSWLASIGLFFEPIGSILSALITDYLGRKRSMLIVNLPLVIAWFMLYKANSVMQIFIANVLLGLGVGLMESPIITYVGEITEPKFRGIMIAYTHVGWTLGLLFVAVLNTLMPWRTVALVCMFVPILTTIALCFVPETPFWLLSKNRPKEAEKSLQWLRGWVGKSSVADELQALERYSERYTSCSTCIRLSVKCSHPLPTMSQKFGELNRMPTLKPLVIVLSLFAIAAFSGITAMQPFIVQIFKAYGSPMEPDKAAALLNFVNNLANLTFLCMIRFTGKRKMYLSTLSVVFLCSIVLSVYGFAVLPNGYNSFDRTQTFELDNPQLGYIPFVCIILLSFCSFCGINTMPWQLISEVFPYKVRGMATGLTAAINYVLTFISTKTYYNLETRLSMPGMVLFNCFINAMGFILMYKILPETENRTLEDIEMHFADNSKKLTNLKIAKTHTKPPRIENGNNTTSNGYENNGFTH